MFTDDACTEFADNNGGRTTFEALSGTELPYSTVSIVGPECVPCLNVENQNDNNDDGEDNDVVSEACQEIYTAAGKCEDNLPEGMVDEPNDNACTYIAGINVIRQDGIITRASTRPNGAATAWIVIFALLFSGLLFYVYYLRMRLGVKHNTLF
jgi:hypothetical protein